MAHYYSDISFSHLVSFLPWSKNEGFVILSVKIFFYNFYFYNSMMNSSFSLDRASKRKQRTRSIALIIQILY